MWKYLTCGLAASVLLMPKMSAAQDVVVNAGPGNQTDPHMNGDLISYTSMVNGGSEIRYFNLATSADFGIPGAPDGSLDFLSDVSGTNVVFTRVEGPKQSICWFDSSLEEKPIEIMPDPASIRRSPAIGGSTVAWQDLTFSTPTEVISEIVTYDLQTGVGTRVTNDAMVDKTAAVSPNGDVIVWEKCATAVSPCDIWQAAKGTGGWVVSQLTNTPESELAPDTDGTTVVYGGIRAASPTGPDIYWTPVGSVEEWQLAMVGQQRNPNISRSSSVYGTGFSGIVPTT